MSERRTWKVGGPPDEAHDGWGLFSDDAGFLYVATTYPVALLAQHEQPFQLLLRAAWESKDAWSALEAWMNTILASDDAAWLKDAPCENPAAYEFPSLTCQTWDELEGYVVERQGRKLVMWLKPEEDSGPR